MIFKLNEKNKTYERIKRKNLASIGWVEKDLEKLISENIQDFISSDELLTIFTERPRKEEPDILALDKNGDLYIFELKRWSGEEENLLQVFRYGQLFGNKDYETLNDLFGKHINTQTSLKEHHRVYFGLEKALSEDDFGGQSHFVIVTDGLDAKTADAINYWQTNGLDIRPLTYGLFEVNGDCYLEFRTFSPCEYSEEYDSTHYILNTNLSNRSEDKNEMIAAKKAAAYWPGHRELIQKLQRGDTVFLYNNGEGIVAYGTADGVLKKAECDGYTDYEYYMHLNGFVELDTPISAARIKEVLSRNIVFRRTLFSISDEDSRAIISEIRSKCQLERKNK